MTLIDFAETLFDQLASILVKIHPPEELKARIDAATAARVDAAVDEAERQKFPQS